MNNDKNIVIKSQSQPDEGEGYSAGQAVRGNTYGEEGLSANVRGDEQKPSEAILTRDESATQDEVLYSSHEEGRRLAACRACARQAAREMSGISSKRA